MTNDEALLWGSSDQFSNPILPKYKHMLKSIILSSLSPPSGSWYFQITNHLSHPANSNFIQSLPDKLIIKSLPNLKNFFSKNIYVWLVASVNWHLSILASYWHIAKNLNQVFQHTNLHLSKSYLHLQEKVPLKYHDHYILYD